MVSVRVRGVGEGGVEFWVSVRVGMRGVNGGEDDEGEGEGRSEGESKGEGECEGVGLGLG
jgi:hypothetical protein